MFIESLFMQNFQVSVVYKTNRDNFIPQPQE